MWPLKLCEVTSSAVSRMEGKANSFIRKWSGLLQCFLAATLYRWNSLHLPLKSITLAYRQQEARELMMLKDSSNKSVKDMHAQVVIGRKWMAEEERQRMVSRLQYQEVEGRVLIGWAGLGWGDPLSLWCRSSKKEGKDLVVSEVSKMGQEKYRVKAMAQGQRSIAQIQ